MKMEFPQRLIERCQAPLEGHQLEGFLTGAGNEKAEVMLIGEAPGEKEANSGKPFIGRAGNVLDGYLQAIDYTREQVYITSVVRSRPYKWGERRPQRKPIPKKINRKPTEKEIFAHAPLLDYQITHVKPRVLVALGGVALRRLLGREMKISKAHGKEYCTRILNHTEEGYIWSYSFYHVFALYHPAAVFYNPGLRGVIEDDLFMLKKIIQ